MALAALIVLDQPWLTLFLAYGFLARVLTGPTLSPLGQLVTRVGTPRLGLEPRPVPGPPKRFAQGIGATLSVTAAVLALRVRGAGAADIPSWGCWRRLRPSSRRSATASGARPSPCSCATGRHPRVGVRALRLRPAAVLLDFYGTLARATQWVSIDVVLAEHGVELADERPAAASGTTGSTASSTSSTPQSRDHYVAWQRERLLAMLAETDVHPGEYELDRREAARRQRDPRARGVRRGRPTCSRALRDRGPAPRDLLELGLGPRRGRRGGRADRRRRRDRVVGVGRRPQAAPADLRAHADEDRRPGPPRSLFVGDTWGPDVVGPRAAGMTPVYLRRDGHWPDDTAPADLDRRRRPDRARPAHPARASTRPDDRETSGMTTTMPAPTTTPGDARARRAALVARLRTTSSPAAPGRSSGAASSSSAAADARRTRARALDALARRPRQARAPRRTRPTSASSSPRSTTRCERLRRWMRPERVHAPLVTKPGARRGSSASRSASCS